MQDLNPELFPEAVAKGADFLEQDGMDFGKWSLLMVNQFGEQIRPDLEQIWTCAHEERQRRQASAPALTTDSQSSPTADQVSHRRRWELSNSVTVLILVVLVGLLLVSVWLGWRERTAQKAATELADATKKDQAVDSAQTVADSPQPVESGLKYWQTKAEKGEPLAQVILGMDYYFGNRITKDYVEAAQLFRKAADQGDPDGQWMLGVCYATGQGLMKDDAEAARWYRKAADRGRAEAQSRLGACYQKGLGVTQDVAAASYWFRKAADQGHAEAQSSLGYMYLLAEGVERDYAKSFQLFRKAADQGDESGLKGLLACYGSGHGVPINYAEAAKLTRHFAEAGDVAEQNNLGIAYEEGLGVTQDFVEAYKWYNLSAVNEGLSPEGYSLEKTLKNAGLDTPSQRRDRLAQGMTREQIAEGQRRAAAFVARKKSDDFSGGSDAKAVPPFSGYESKASGTAFFVSEDGYLMSNFHVVERASRIRIKTSAGLLAAKVVKSDPVNDIAVLKVSGSFRALPIARNREDKLGESIFTVRFPNIQLQGTEPKLTKGELSSLAGAQDDPRHFQISAAVQPGNSGGPLLDACGNVIGIVTARLSDAAALETSGLLPQNVNYAIKISYALPLLESVPGLIGKLKASHPAKERKFEDAVQEARDATVLVLVY